MDERISETAERISRKEESITRVEERLAALKENVATKADLEALRSRIVIWLYLGLTGSVVLLATFLRIWPDGN